MWTSLCGLWTWLKMQSPLQSLSCSDFNYVLSAKVLLLPLTTSSCRPTTMFSIESKMNMARFIYVVLWEVDDGGLLCSNRSIIISTGMLGKAFYDVQRIGGRFAIFTLRLCKRASGRTGLARHAVLHSKEITCYKTCMLQLCERVWMAYMEGQECNPHWNPPCSKGVSHMSE